MRPQSYLPPCLAHSACLHVCLPVSVRAPAAVSRLEGFSFLVCTVSTTVSPQGAADSFSTASLLSMRHNWAAGGGRQLVHFIIPSLCNASEIKQSFKSCSCCSGSARGREKKKCFQGAEESQWCKWSFNAALNSLPFAQHQTGSLLCWFYFTQAH